MQSSAQPGFIASMADDEESEVGKPIASSSSSTFTSRAMFFPRSAAYEAEDMLAILGFSPAPLRRK